jgi:hypothetical protein
VKETFSPPAIPPKLLGLIVFCSTGSDTSSIIVFPISIASLRKIQNQNKILERRIQVRLKVEGCYP